MTNPLRPIPRWLRGLGQAALWVGAILGLLSIVLTVATFAFGVQPLVFRSGSMSPEIKAGALAFAKEAPASQVVVGDVVSVVDTDGRRVTHRVMAKAAGEADSGTIKLTLKGDANEAADADPYPVKTVDKVMFDLPYAGYVAVWLSGPVGMFLAGLLVAGVLISLFLKTSRRSSPGRRSIGRRAATSKGLTLLFAMGLLAPVGLVQGVATGTDAAFTDNPEFKAGVIGAHRVLAFNWEVPPTPHCTNVGTKASDNFYGSVQFHWKIRDKRYETLWTSPGLRGPKVSNQILPAGTSVSTTFTGGVNGGSSDFFTPAPAQLGPVAVTGQSRLRNKTPEWTSAATRVQSVDRNIDGRVRCSGEEVPPDISITRPAGGSTSRSGVQESINADCGSSPVKAACGTAQASGDKTITKIEYELRQGSGFTGTRCWDPTSGSYTRASCGTWRDATWTAGSGARSWSVLGNAYRDFLFVFGDYTLTVRVTDSTNQADTQKVEFRVFN